MKIRKLMTTNVIILEADATAYDAVKTMNKHGIGCVLVIYHGEVVGILTENDLLKRVLEKCKNPKGTSVSEIMTRQVVLGTPDLELVEATKLMFENKVKKLPIVEKSRLVGILTVTDVARAMCVDQSTIELFEKLSNMHRI
jgi:CBS domain-containing protein